MKLEVGMYYRYKGIIGKYYKPDLGKPFFTNQHKYTYSEIANYGKFSHNIIELIEVGDYVNGEEVFGLYEYDGKRYVDVDRVCYSEEEIKTIVTKEQFESMEYKAGE